MVLLSLADEVNDALCDGLGLPVDEGDRIPAASYLALPKVTFSTAISVQASFSRTAARN